MLKDYRNYILNIRNSLIQCGVDISSSPLLTYKDLFYEADKLSQIIWFYSVMGISNSPFALKGFFIDITGYYKEKMRQKYYDEFKDYYTSYKHISKLAYLAGSSDSNLSYDKFGEEEFDLFSSDEQVIESEIPKQSEVEVQVEIPEQEEVVSVEEVHGTYIDEENIYSKIDKVLGTGYIPAKIGVNLLVQGSENAEVHGVLLDEVAEASEDDDTNRSFLGKSSDVEEEYDSHGTILDDVVLAESSEGSEDTYNDIRYSEDDEDSYDDIHYSDEEDEEPYDDIHYSDEDEEPYDDIHYSDEEDEEPYDDIHYSDDDEEPYGDIHYSDDEDDSVEPQRVKAKPTKNIAKKEKVNTSGDMSDIIQDTVNGILTKGKQFILSEAGNLRKGD